MALYDLVKDDVLIPDNTLTLLKPINKYVSIGPGKIKRRNNEQKWISIGWTLGSIFIVSQWAHDKIQVNPYLLQTFI